jgi:hypothetical protein
MIHYPHDRSRWCRWLPPRCDCGKWWRRCVIDRHGVAGNYVRRWP